MPISERPGEKPKASTMEDVVESFEEKIRRFEKEAGVKVPREEDADLASSTEIPSEEEALDALTANAIREKIAGGKFAEGLSKELKDLENLAEHNRKIDEEKAEQARLIDEGKKTIEEGGDTSWKTGGGGAEEKTIPPPRRRPPTPDSISAK